MSKLRPYIAVDIETTGLDTSKSQILQIGWVVDDGVSPLDQLARGSILIQNDEITYGENYALGMNAWIFQELMKPFDQRKYPTMTPAHAIDEFLMAVNEAAYMAEEWDKANGVKRPKRAAQLAGKNVANFDWPIISNHIAKLTQGIVDTIDHRFIDCGAIFFEQFGRNPGFADINKLIGWKDINHDALDDAINVVVAIRYRMNIPIK